MNSVASASKPLFPFRIYAFVGPQGGGKTTVIRFLHRELSDRGYPVMPFYSFAAKKADFRRPGGILTCQMEFLGKFMFRWQMIPDVLTRHPMIFLLDRYALDWARCYSPNRDPTHHGLFDFIEELGNRYEVQRIILTATPDVLRQRITTRAHLEDRLAQSGSPEECARLCTEYTALPGKHYDSTHLAKEELCAQILEFILADLVDFPTEG